MRKRAAEGAALLVAMKKYRCNWCGHIYDPAEGDPARAIPPGTPFESLPDTWRCPDCRAPKADFTPVEDAC